MRIATIGMALLDQFRIEALPKKWADEGTRWQETYFPEMSTVFDRPNWSRFYPEIPMPRLSVITAKPDGFAGFAQKVVGNTPATADLSGRLWTADKMPDAQFMTALRIIRAQASTELGSIQQHRMVYEQLDRGSLTGLDKEIVEGMHRTDPTGHQLDAISFSKKRVCVEELRHHMQMAGVLTLDPTFDKARWGRHWATETMEELFAMKPGEHVLDAFNIEFKSLMDSATFMSFIDRVGKFQLEMQHHFLYGPMALSMPWMRFLEESYHLAAGETLMKAIAVAGILDGGNFGIEDLQKTLNMWFPRGLEMFGSELGGDLVKGVFKTLKNAEAQKIYIDEVLGKLKDVNLAIIQAKARGTRDEADAILRKITEKGESLRGLAKEDLLFLPDRRFFRIRGLAEYGDYRVSGSDAAGVGYVYLPYDVHGALLMDRGKTIERAAYAEYLKSVLPERYMSSRHWSFVKDEFLFNEKWGSPEPA
jgi:1,2-phenylacetyl-CoA epoxidase catalytic subunit